MEEIVRALRQLLRSIKEIVSQGFDLGAALLDLMWTSPVSLSVPAFLGITASVLTLGLLLGRLSKREGEVKVRKSKAREEDRIVLDLERLRPLGLSAEEEAESEVMDISRLRRDEMTERAEPGDPRRRRGPGSAPAR